MNDRNRARLLPVVRASAILLGLSASVFVACDSDGDGTDDPEGDPADCRLIANRCHPYDEESPLAAECHEVGHDGSSPAKCTEMRARCLDECPPLPDAGTGGGSGASSGGSGGTTSGGATSGGATSTGGTAGSSTGGQGATGGGAGQATGGSAGSGGTSTGGSAGTSNGGNAGSGTAGGGTAGSGGRAGGGGTAGGTGETACETLGRVCHEAAGSVAEECHDLGHDGDEPACEARFAECLAACT